MAASDQPPAVLCQASRFFSAVRRSPRARLVLPVPLYVPANAVLCIPRVPRLRVRVRSEWDQLFRPREPLVRAHVPVAQHDAPASATFRAA